MKYYGLSEKTSLIIDISKLVENLVENLAYCTLQQAFTPIILHFGPVQTIFYDETA